MPISVSNLSRAFGSSGFSGTSGTSGRSGNSGTSGYSGSGLSGFSGVGSSGFSGTSGYSGTSGTSGTVGLSGLSGTSGNSGFSGISGTSGYSGPSGVSGTSGTSGLSGTSGISGRSGSSGVAGSSGASGSQGISGTSGYSGASFGFTPVQQGGGTGQLNNKVYIGWTGTRLKAQVDSTDMGDFLLTALSSGQKIQLEGLGVGTAASSTTGEIRATNNITAYYSDKNLKSFHGKIENPIQKIMQLNGYYFTENELAKSLGYDNDRMQVGVSAQEVEAVLPEVVTEAPIDSKYKTVWYEKLVPLLIEAIKEQQKEIENLKDIVNGKL